LQSLFHPAIVFSLFLVVSFLSHMVVSTCRYFFSNLIGFYYCTM